MANLPEISEFTAGIYQLETTDLIEAGPDGIDNLQAKGLSNRTLWLKNQLGALSNTITDFAASLAALTNRVINLEAFASKKFTYYLYKGSINIGNIPVPNVKTMVVSFPNVGTSSYMVSGCLISNSSNQAADTTVIWTVKSNKSATSFTICFRETDDLDQQLSFEYVLIEMN